MLALIVDQINQLETDVKQETVQGKRKRSGRFNLTDSLNRRWANESILVGSTKKRVMFDELTPIQFSLGFVKNRNDTIGLLTRRLLMAELYEMLKLIEVTLWLMAKGAHIAVMHLIKNTQDHRCNNQSILHVKIRFQMFVTILEYHM